MLPRLICFRKKEVVSLKLDGIIKKLQKAIISKGLIVKIKNDQFWSEEQKRLINVKQICILTSYQNKNGEWTQKDYEILKNDSYYFSQF